MSKRVTFAEPISGVFTADIPAIGALPEIPCVPIAAYSGFLRPNDSIPARQLGDRFAAEMTEGFIGDFERSAAYCERNGERDPDKMVHVSTFTIIDGIVYMTYYANTDTDGETPSRQGARLAFCPENDPEELTVITLQKAGDTLDGEAITGVYDTVLLHKDDRELYVMWTAKTTQYYRFFCVYDIATATVGPIRVNRFKVGDVVNDFSVSGMQQALYANGIAHRRMFADIGIMQKITPRVENGEIYYYTGIYSGAFTAIAKSCDFVTWEYVASPDFPNNSLWENATYVLGDRVYYFARQNECLQGFLTYYDLKTGKWAPPFLIADEQSRSDFFMYNNQLYLMHAPKDRKGVGIVRVDTEDLTKSVPILVADMKSGCFYPFTRVYGKRLYVSYTVSRLHIRLTSVDFEKYVAL